MENPYRGFVPVCICVMSIALRFRSCKRPQGNFSHFGWYDKFLRQNWAKWRKNTSPEGVFKEGETIFRGTSFFSNGGQRPPPPFAALRQRRDLIIANPRVRVSKGEGSQPLPFWKHPRLPQNIPYPDPCVMMYDHSTGPTAPVVL